MWRSGRAPQFDQQANRAGICGSQQGKKNEEMTLDISQRFKKKDGQWYVDGHLVKSYDIVSPPQSRSRLARLSLHLDTGAAESWSSTVFFITAANAVFVVCEQEIAYEMQENLSLD